ncbi:MAG: glucokinase [Betaproteobacteria bacterium]|nr:MAG: glucokinase [Betaproteobacteria bacterium]
MLLAADIGGTKALLALAEGSRVRFERRYRCREFASFGALLERFRAEAREALGAPPRIARACLGVAGPVSDGRVRVTHLGWQIDTRDLGIASVRLLNDFEASAHGLARLRPGELVTLQPGAPLAAAPRLVIGAGTGLGVAWVLGRGRGQRVVCGEGGHAAFAPADEVQEALWRHLRGSLGRVELEHVISGAGLARIYAFLHDSSRVAEGAALPAAPAASDSAAAISQAALESGDPLALAALDLFIACYGAAAGDYALAVLARGGVYVTGGIAPRILPRLRAGGFIAAFGAKAAFAGAARSCPVHVVTNERLGLLGAAAAAPR